MASLRDARVEANAETRLNLSATIVKLIVGAGEKQKCFHVHSSILEARSKFFKKCLSGPWKEAVDQAVTLQDDDPELLELYLQLLYRDALPTKNPNIEEDYKAGLEYNTLSKYTCWQRNTWMSRLKIMSSKR